MCLRFDNCFGFGAPRTDDDRYHASASRTQPPHGLRSHYNANTNGNGNGYPAHRAAEAEAPNDAMRDHARVVVVPTGGGHGHAPATGAQEKAAYPYAGADGTSKQQQQYAGAGGMLMQQQPYAGADGALKQQPAASTGRVAAADGARGVAQHNYYYEPAHREGAADSYYKAATATADHEMY